MQNLCYDWWWNYFKQNCKTVFEEMAQTGVNPKQIKLEAKGLVQISDPNIILPIIDDVIAKILIV